MDFGLDQDEFRTRMRACSSESEWAKPHEVSCQRLSEGTIVVASVPSGKSGDLMMGCRMETWLFADGRYWSHISGLWLPPDPGLKREGRPSRFDPETDGCDLSRSCFTCREVDCVRY